MTTSERFLVSFYSISRPVLMRPCSLDSANAKLQGVVNLVKQVNNGGSKLIDGIGTQMHLSVRNYRVI